MSQTNLIKRIPSTMLILAKRMIKAALRPLVRPMLERIRMISREELTRFCGAGGMASLMNEVRSMIRSETISVRNEISSIREETEKAKEYAKVSAFNQIALNVEDKEGLCVYLPCIDDDLIDKNRKPVRRNRFPIRLNRDGRLLLHPRNTANRRSKRVFVPTIGKSGTHFIDTILKDLGFQQIPFTAYSSACTCKTQNGTLWGNLPFGIQEKLVQPGQYMVGHIFGEELQNLLGKNELLLSVRDLRYALVSWVRFVIPGAKEKTMPEQLITALHDETMDVGFSQTVLDRARSFLPLMGRESVLRFEELIAEEYEKAEPSVKAMAKVADASTDEVFAAFRKNFRSKSTNTSSGLSTYTGRFSEIDEIWTPEVEAAFVSVGADRVNEQLGYPKSLESYR